MPNIREIIDQTMKNADLLYQEVGDTLVMIEEKMRYAGFKGLGNADCAWETSGAYNKASQWLSKWFARVYYQEVQPTKAVGYCLHLGAYQQEWEDKLAALGVHLPVFGVSLIDFPQPVSGLARTNVYNSFSGAQAGHTSATSTSTPTSCSRRL
jgi:hypothetical protein